MVYILHITRKKNWDDVADEYGPDIPLDEWLAVVETDPELRRGGFGEAPIADGSPPHHANASIAVWTKWPRHRQAGEMAWFRRLGGNIIAANPDRDIRRKLWRIAQQLHARVQGDGGEFYDRFGNPAADAAETQGYWRALCRSLVLRFIWGASAGGEGPAEAFARFPVVNSIYKTSPSGTPQVIGSRVLHVVMRKGSLTPQQRSAIGAARERAKIFGIDLFLTEEEPR